MAEEETDGLHDPSDGDSDSDVDGGDEFDGSSEYLPDADSSEYVDNDGNLDTTGIWSPLGGQASMGSCLDGIDQTIEGFGDCEELGCFDNPGCCLDIQRLWVGGNFSTCADLPDCTWSVFPAADPPIAIETPWLVFGRSTIGEEVGVYTEPVVELRGGVTLTFAAALSPEGCPERGCRQVLGVALTEQASLSSGTGVIPAVGVAIEGQSSMVHYMIEGQVVASAELSREELTTPQGYAIQISKEGTLSFFRGLELDWIGDDPLVLLGGPSELTIRQGRFSSPTLLRLALHGRFSGEGTGILGGVVLSQPICDVPNGFTRESPYAVVRPDSENTHIGSPSVVYRPLVGDLLMIYELDRQLAVATSTDGIQWEAHGLVLPGNSPTDYGDVARRAPTAIAVESLLGGDQYHLWFEGVSEFAGIAAGDPPKRAIIHATSVDGLIWEEANDGSSVVLTGSPDHAWRAEVGQPSVVITEDGNLLMVFVGTNPLDGTTGLGRGSCDQFGSWSFGETQMAFSSEKMPFERDGVADPMLLRRGTLLHLWYTGLSGSRSSIGYAVIGRDEGDWVWHRYGPVLEPIYPWEFQRISAPAVLCQPSEELAFENILDLRMWYEAGLQDKGLLGLASREIPGNLFE